MSLTAEETIRALLASYVDACGPDGLSGGGGDRADDRLLQMSPLWHHGSYASLEACLRTMRERERAVYWHLAERYLRCERRRGEGCSECGEATAPGVRHYHTVAGRRLRFARMPITITTWDPRVDLQQVAAGVAWLTAEHLRRFGPPYLPRELRPAAA